MEQDPLADLFQARSRVLPAEDIDESLRFVVDLEANRVVQPTPLVVLEEGVSKVHRSRLRVLARPVREEQEVHVEEVTLDSTIGDRGELLPHEFRRVDDQETEVVGVEEDGAYAFDRL